MKKPLHPYTEGLIKSIPKIGVHEKLYMIPFKSGANQIKKDVDSVLVIAYAMDICSEIEPELKDIGDGRKVRCWLHLEKPDMQTVKAGEQE